MLQEIGTALALANSAKSLFGGGGKSESDSMKSQVAWQQYAAQVMPKMQVMGLREAGLNPMLAVGHGISSPPPITSSPGSEDQAHSARQQASTAATIGAATVQNLNASSAKSLADADLASAQADNERKYKPGQMTSQTGLMDSQKALANVNAALEAMRTSHTEQLWKTEGFETKLRELEHSFAAENYGVRVVQAQVLLEKARAEMRSARTKADVDKALLYYQRLAEIARDASGAVSGLIPWNKLNSAKSLRDRSPSQ